jgi:hypothetical protein
LPRYARERFEKDYRDLIRLISRYASLLCSPPLPLHEQKRILKAYENLEARAEVHRELFQAERVRGLAVKRYRP